jgi:uncharacterized protein
MITASKLYDFVQCPHRVWRDVYGPQEEKATETNPFVQLLWDRGTSHEEKVVAILGTYFDLSSGSLVERQEQTLAALRRKEPLIYQGVLSDDNLLGIPDILKLLPDGTYIPVEIKSGMGFEGGDEEEGEEGKPKKHYAVQLALYVELLQRLGMRPTSTARVIDIHQNEAIYNLDQPMGVKNKMTYWEFYLQTKENVRILLENEAKNKPAMASICKLCPWYGSCKKWCKENDDLTNIFYLGRSKRDTLSADLQIEKIADLFQLDIDEVLATKEKDKTFLKGFGEKTLKQIITRANILSRTKEPVVYGDVFFPEVSYELFFDIEDDPTREFVYMHGVYERHHGNERYIDFTAKSSSKESEKEAWVEFWKYINQLPKDDFAIYYYSHHEKTTYKKLQKQYPDVISSDALESFFENPNVIDLYKVVLKATDWPVGSYSLKELAVYLGFRWRDETPSGALSIQWYNQYLESKNEKQLERILLYNEDDCKATMVLKDGIKRISSH